MEKVINCREDAKQKVLVIIINYKTSALISNLLKSIQEDFVEARIVILDNASTDESFKMLLEINDDRVELLRTPINLGYTGGINYVLDKTAGIDSLFDYFFLLNPDALCKKNLISMLLKQIKSDRTVACVSPRILNTSGAIWYSGGQIDVTKGKVINNAFSFANATKIKKSYVIDVYSGCAVLCDLHKINRAGRFNEDLFMYYDEADLSMRLNNLGYKLLYVPNIEIVHDVSFTTRGVSYLKTYYMTRNKFIVFRNTMTSFYKLYFLVYELVFHLKNKRFRSAYYHLKGYIDFLAGKTGALN